MDEGREIQEKSAQIVIQTDVQLPVKVRGNHHAKQCCVNPQVCQLVLHGPELVGAEIRDGVVLK